MIDSQAENFLAPNDSGMIIFRLQDTMLSQTAADIVTLKNQDFAMQFGVTDYNNAGGFSNGSVVMQKNETEYPFGVLSGQLLDSMILHSSDLRIRVNSNIQHSGQLIITFPELKKNGNAYVRALNITPQGGVFSYDITHRDLQGYTLDLTRANEGVNSLFIQYTLMLTDNGSSFFDPASTMNIQIEMHNNQYAWLLGYVGFFETNIGPSAINLSFLEKVTFGSFYLEAPLIRFIITNSFGLPTKYGFEYANVFNRRLDKVDPITGVPYYDINPAALPIPTFSYPTQVTPITDTISLFGQASNFSQLIYDLPSSIDYSIKVNLNPPTANPGRNFMTKDSKIDVVTVFDLPLWGYTPRIAFADTINFNIGQDSAMFDYIKKIQITLDIANGFPHDIRLQGIITNEYGAPLDSLFSTLDEQFIIESGTLVNGRINQQTGKTRKVTILEYSKEKFDKWKNAKYIIIAAQYNTTLPQQGSPQESVIYFRDYGIDVKINARAEIEVDEHL
jgi:hypothetical protein